MFCERCGKENPNEAKFCRACGSPLQIKAPQPDRKQVSAATSQAKKKSGKAGKSILVIVLIFVIAAAGLLAFIKLSEGGADGSGVFSGKAAIRIPVVVKERNDQNSTRYQVSIDGRKVYSSDIKSLEDSNNSFFEIKEYNDAGKVAHITRYYLYEGQVTNHFSDTFEYDKAGRIVKYMADNTIRFNSELTESKTEYRFSYDSKGGIEDITVIESSIENGEVEDSRTYKADIEVNNSVLESYTIEDDDSQTVCEYEYNEDGSVAQVITTVSEKGEVQYRLTREYDGSGKGLFGPELGEIVKQRNEYPDGEDMPRRTYSFTVEYLDFKKGTIVVPEDVTLKEIDKDLLEELLDIESSFEDNREEWREEAAAAASKKEAEAAIAAEEKAAAEKEAAEKEAAEKAAEEKEAAEKAAAEKAAAEKAAAEKDASDESFYYGTWTAVKAEYEGISVDIGLFLDEAMSFEFKEGGVVTVYMGEESDNGKWEITPDGINVEDEFIMKRDGNDLVIEEDGVILRFERK